MSTLITNNNDQGNVLRIGSDRMVRPINREPLVLRIGSWTARTVVNRKNQTRF
jgi:hypothetical protein